MKNFNRIIKVKDKVNKLLGDLDSVTPEKIKEITIETLESVQETINLGLGQGRFDLVGDIYTRMGVICQHAAAAILSYPGKEVMKRGRVLTKKKAPVKKKAKKTKKK